MEIANKRSPSLMLKLYMMIQMELTLKLDLKLLEIKKEYHQRTFSENRRKRVRILRTAISSCKEQRQYLVTCSLEMKAMEGEREKEEETDIMGMNMMEGTSLELHLAVLISIYNSI